MSDGIAHAYGYDYDSIGNRLWSAENATTNTYSANCLNQYKSVLRDSPLLGHPLSGQPSAGGYSSPREMAFDADGNMTNDGERYYVYDAENRLLSAYPQSPTNGSLAVVNNYDHRHRRIRKFVRRFDGSAWDTVATHAFVWDGSNIALEKVAFADGTTKTCEYFWGPDKSGTEQGAGGVGGLLAVSIDGVFYVPCYDHNGNVVVYVSEFGATAAQYVYDPYGKVVEQSGDFAESLSFGFSTKYHDRETGMVSYQRRFYLPALGRWLNLDPIEEEGGENLYGFVDNRISFGFDKLGLYRWVAIYYSRADQPEFRRAAETYIRKVTRSKNFNSTCDGVIIKGALTAEEFSSVWDEIKRQTDRIGNQYEIKSLHIFTHSGPGMLHLRESSLNHSRIKALPRLNWAKDGKVVCHGCNTGIHDEDENSVTRSLSEGQGVDSWGQTGFSQFSKNPKRRSWFTRVDGNSQDVYLWSYGNGGRKWTFGSARPPQIDKPTK